MELYIIYVSVMVIFCVVFGFGGNVDYVFLGFIVYIGFVLVRFVFINYVSFFVSMVKWNNVMIWYMFVIFINLNKFWCIKMIVVFFKNVEIYVY